MAQLFKQMFIESIIGLVVFGVCLGLVYRTIKRRNK
jgi:hypothetical protein